MLEACGAGSAEELFSHLPEAVKLNRPLDLAPGISEYEIVDISGTARRRTPTDTRRSWERACTATSVRYWWTRWSRAASS